MTRTFKNTPLARRLGRLLESLGIEWPGGPTNVAIERTRAGRHQQSAGAWSWFLVRADGETNYPSIGSPDPVSRFFLPGMKAVAGSGVSSLSTELSAEWATKSARQREQRKAIARLKRIYPGRTKR